MESPQGAHSNGGSVLTTATSGLKLPFAKRSSANIDSHHNGTIETSIPPMWLRGTSSANVSDEETLEKEVMKKEKLWMITHEIPFVSKEVRKLLEQCLMAINPTAASALVQPEPKPNANPDLPKLEPLTIFPKGRSGFHEEKTSPDSQLLSLESSEGMVKGSFRVEGWNITEAEIVLKSPKYNKGAVVKTSVSIGNPLKLSQIYDGYNLVLLGLRSLDDLEKLLQQSNETNEIARNVDHISQSLRSAMDELVFPGKDMFPKYNSSITFYPPLPPEYVIYFSVNNKELNVSAYCIHAVGHANQKANTQSPIGQVFTYKRNGVKQLVEILDYAGVSAQLTKLETAMDLINKAYLLMAELKDKIILFP